MEAALIEAVHTTIATFVGKAITGEIENSFAKAVDKAVEESVKAMGESVKAIEGKLKAVEERSKAAEEEVRVVNEGYKAITEDFKAIQDDFTAAVDRAVKDQISALEKAMQKKFDRKSKKERLEANITAAQKALCERDEVRMKYMTGSPDLGRWFSSKHLEYYESIRSWREELNDMEKGDEEKL